MIFLQGPEPEPGQVLPDLFGDELEEVHHELRPPAEPRPQLGVLGSDADRAGVQVADTHHDAARHHERRAGEAELFRAEQCGDDHVPAGLQLAVRLHDDPVADLSRAVVYQFATPAPRAPACLSDVSGATQCRRRAR